MHHYSEGMKIVAMDAGMGWWDQNQGWGGGAGGCGGGGGEKGGGGGGGGGIVSCRLMDSDNQYKM